MRRPSSNGTAPSNVGEQQSLAEKLLSKDNMADVRLADESDDLAQVQPVLGSSLSGASNTPLRSMSNAHRSSEAFSPPVNRRENGSCLSAESDWSRSVPPMLLTTPRSGGLRPAVERTPGVASSKAGCRAWNGILSPETPCTPSRGGGSRNQQSRNRSETASPAKGAVSRAMPVAVVSPSGPLERTRKIMGALNQDAYKGVPQVQRRVFSGKAAASSSATNAVDRRDSEKDLGLQVAKKRTSEAVGADTDALHNSISDDTPDPPAGTTGAARGGTSSVGLPGSNSAGPADDEAD